MTKADEMFNYLPEFLANLREMNQIIKSEAPEFEDSEMLINDILDQQFVTTATWGLDRWERIAHVSRTSDATVDERRRNIINHLSSNQPATHQLLESLLNNYLQRETADIQFNKDNAYLLDIHFDFEDFNWQRMLVEFRNAVPAHLDFTIYPTDSHTIQIIHEAAIKFREYYRVKDMRVGYSLTKSISEVNL